MYSINDADKRISLQNEVVNEVSGKVDGGILEVSHRGESMPWETASGYRGWSGLPNQGVSPMFHQPVETGLRDHRTAIVLNKEQASDHEHVASPQC